MANTYSLISSYTVGAGGASSIDFTSIPSTYTDLMVYVSGRDTSGFADLRIRFNSDSGSNYSYRDIEGAGTTVSSTSGSSLTILTTIEPIPAGTSIFSNVSIYIPTYTSSKYKSVSIDAVGEANATNARLILNAGLWSNTSAINAISLFTSGSGFTQYSTAYLYGIKSS